MITLNELQKQELNELFVDKAYELAYKYIYNNFGSKMDADQAYWFEQAAEINRYINDPVN